MKDKKRIILFHHSSSLTKNGKTYTVIISQECLGIFSPKGRKLELGQNIFSNREAS
jgi:hypothetical protein